MTLRIELDERTTDELAQLARGKEIAPAELAKEAIRSYLREEARRAMTAEIDAFTALHPQLLATIPGQFAAVHQGELVDHDVDQMALLRRIERTQRPSALSGSHSAHPSGETGSRDHPSRPLPQDRV
jgi:hypothetical protein